MQALEPGGAPNPSSFSCVSTSVTKMRANMEEVPYVFEKGKVRVKGAACMLVARARTHKHMLR